MYVKNLPKNIRYCMCIYIIGNIIGENAVHLRLMNALSDFYSRTNNILCNFSYVDCDIKYKLLKTFAACFYGCQLWDFTGPDFDRVYTAWRKVLRKLFCLPPALLPFICNDMPFDIQIYKRFLQFLLICLITRMYC